MKTLVVIGKEFVSRLLFLSFVIVVSVMLSTVPASATEFEVGTQFGISHIVPDDDDSSSITFTQIPSSIVFLGSSPTSLYATWYLGEQFAIGPEFSLGRMSISNEYSGETETESITSLYLGGRAAFFLGSHTESTPYILGRVSQTTVDDGLSLFGADENLFSFGLGVGYQWRIRSAFVLRVEAQYQRVLVEDDNANEFSFIIGIGTRFGSNEN